MSVKINTGIINDYSIKPKSLTEYTAFRGVIDFSQIGQFDQFETGYSFMSVLQMPKFMTMLATYDSDVARMVNSFRHMLEYEFRGFTGLPDMTGDSYEIGDGTNTVKIISNVTRDTSVTLNSTYYERSGSLITRFAEYYLSGIKDPMSKAKTYHGLIKNGLMEPNVENEMFTFMYYVTDNTYLRIEKAWLLSDVQLTKAEDSMYDSTKGDISNKELTLEWNCFPITGAEVDKAARVLLQDITGVSVTKRDSAGGVNYAVVSGEDEGNVITDGSALYKSNNGKRTIATLDSSNYEYGIMNSSSSHAVAPLANAIDTANI
jgi:hypothetical protein